MLKTFIHTTLDSQDVVLAMPTSMATVENVFIMYSEDYVPYSPIVFDNY